MQWFDIDLLKRKDEVFFSMYSAAKKNKEWADLWLQ